MPDVVARASALDAVVVHARHAMPAECAGLLLGTSDGAIVRVRALRLRQATAQSFEVDALDLPAAEEEADSAGLTVVGCYHSHPRSPPVPSRRDLRGGAWPNLHLIVSLSDPGDPVLRCYVVGRRDWREIGLRVVADHI